jgi:hypothetical protein
MGCGSRDKAHEAPPNDRPALRVRPSRPHTFRAPVSKAPFWCLGFDGASVPLHVQKLIRRECRSQRSRFVAGYSRRTACRSRDRHHPARLDNEDDPSERIFHNLGSVRATTFESAHLAFSCDCGGVERTHQCAGVLLQNVTVDILDRVTGPMIAGIVWATSRTAEQAGLSL